MTNVELFADAVLVVVLAAAVLVVVLAAAVLVVVALAVVVLAAAAFEAAVVPGFKVEEVFALLAVNAFSYRAF